MMAVERSVDRKRRWRRLGYGKAFFGLLGSLFLIAMPAMAAEFPLAAKQTAVGAVEFSSTHEPDTLRDLGRHYDLGFTQLMAANRGVNPWIPGNGRQIIVPNFYLLPD